MIETYTYPASKPNVRVRHNDAIPFYEITQRTEKGIWELKHFDTTQEDAVSFFMRLVKA